MSDQTKNINVNLKDNFKQTGDNAKKFNKVVFDTKSAINDVLKSSDSFEKKLKDVDKIVKETPLNVRDMNKQIQAYQSIALSAGRETPVGKQALKQAADLRDRYIDIQNETKRLADDQKNLQGVIQIGSTVVAGYGAVQSAMALTGVESEELRETMTKLMAAQTLLNSVNQIATSLEKESSAMLLLKDIRTKVLTSSLYAYATAQGVATKGLKLFRLALVATGIGAIVVGIGLLVANFDKLKGGLTGGIEGFKKMGVVAKLAMLPLLPLIATIDLVKAGLEKLNIINDEQERQIEKQLDLQNEQLELTKKQIARRLKQIELEQRYRADRIKNLELDLESAKNEKDRAKIREKITDETLKGFEDERNAIRENHKTRIANSTILLNKLKKQYNEENNSIFINREKLERYYKYYRDQERIVAKLKKQLREDNFQGIVEINTKERAYLEGNDKKDEERDKAKLEKYKTYLQERLNARRKIEDLEDSLLEEGIDKELEINRTKFARLVEDTKKNTKLTREERNKLIALYEEQGQQKAQDIRDKYALKELQAERKRQQEIANQNNAFLDELASIEEANYQRTLSDQERELLAVQDKYFRLETLAQGNADALNEIQIARMNEENEIYLKYQNERDKADADLKQKQIDRENTLRETRITLTAQSFDALSQIVGAFNTNNERDAKKQFKITKALNLASAVTNTALAVTGALTAGGNPIKLATGQQFVEAGIAGAMGLANIVKIASAKFEGGGSTGGTSTPSGAVSTPSVPNFNIVGNNNINQLAEIQGQPTKAYVVSDEVTTAQALDRKAQDFATL